MSIADEVLEVPVTVTIPPEIMSEAVDRSRGTEYDPEEFLSDFVRLVPRYVVTFDSESDG